MSKIELKSIKELLDTSFYIPSYQRGYRWTRQEVKDLLSDIDEFMSKGDDNYTYCIQPLVVGKNKSDKGETEQLDYIHQAKNLEEVRAILQGSWDVIDGQQRLTTVYIILKYLGTRLDNLTYYTLQYQTRATDSINSKIFLENIEKLETRNKKNANIDYYHFTISYEETSKWFKNKEVSYLEKFRNVLLKQVKFIWYEVENEDPESVFTRLNIGKISLTNAELIKALLLNKSNFTLEDKDRIAIEQTKIATQWDNIEYTLQNSEFWLFLNKKSYKKQTRIDFIFEIIEKNDLLKVCENNPYARMDYYKTFAYFNGYIKSQKKNIDKAIHNIWHLTQSIFQVFQEWFDNLELYHYIGYLIYCGYDAYNILTNWHKYETKNDFLKFYLMTEIDHVLKKNDSKNLNKERDVNRKKEWTSLLLLHNIETVIQQNKIIAENSKYKQGVFYRFPFNLFKIENWNIEHIDSSHKNAMSDPRQQKEWLLNSYIGIQEDELKNEITNFLHEIDKNPANEDIDNKFQVLYKKITELEVGNIELLKDSEKNLIWNYVLLDEHTNKGYGNAIFPAKRRILIGKDRAKKILVPTYENGEIKPSQEVDADSAFIPPCTKYAFLKFYSPDASSPLVWGKRDAINYKANIAKVLDKFLKDE